MGGKRLRPRLVLIGCGLAGGDPEKAVPAAMSVELLHNFTLIHDDIMDQAESRRGKPTVHMRWDTSAAILSGDSMFALAMAQLDFYTAENGFTPETGLRLYRDFSQASITVCEGQAMDMDFEASLEVSLDDYLEMIRCKTAALIQTSLTMGGSVAEADEETIHELGQIGLDAGIAFQIQDDLLDATADPDKFGKRKGGDIYEGKKTWLTIQLLNRLSGEEKSKVEQILQNRASTAQDVEGVIRLYEEHGVISDAVDAIKNRYISCLERLDHFPDSTFKDEIRILMDKLTKREN